MGLKATIKPAEANKYSFEIDASVALAVTATVPVSLTIGNDTGSATVKPKTEKC